MTSVYQKINLWLLFPFVAIACSCAIKNGMETTATPQQQYNILFIAVDDLNDWTGFLGQYPQTLTPNMDKLAAQGMAFEKAYCAAPVCNPSRAAIMSGYRCATTGIYHNEDDVFSYPLIQQSLMLPQYFSKYGYQTMARGKIYHTPATGQHTWDVWSKTAGGYGNVKKEPGKMANGIPVGEMPENMDWGPTDLPFEETQDFLTADWAAKQLADKHEKPFFLACGLFRPHLKWHVPQAFFDKFNPDLLQLPLVKEDDLNDVAEKKPMPTKEYLTIKKYGKEKEALQAYLASINYADACIGHLLDALDKSKYRDNTIVVLWGDHGWHLGEKLRYKKFTLWDRAIRTSLLIKVPGMTPAGSRSGRTVSLLDLYPTLIDLCGLPPNEKNEGNSIVPLLKNPTTEWLHPALTQMGKDRNSLRNERWRYLRYEDGGEELYDHQNDPNEWTNLAGMSEYKQIKDALEKQLDDLLKKTKTVKK